MAQRHVAAVVVVEAAAAEGGAEAAAQRRADALHGLAQRQLRQRQRDRRCRPARAPLHQGCHKKETVG